MQVEDAQGQRQTPEAMACTILAYLQAGSFCSAFIIIWHECASAVDYM